MIGFAQIGLRSDYVEGTQSSPVGYIEGIFVVPEFRKMGVARQLLMAAERWSLSQGCTEMGSDTELSNELSQRFHKSCGFEEAGVVVHFTKRIQS